MTTKTCPAPVPAWSNSCRRYYLVLPGGRRRFVRTDDAIAAWKAFAARMLAAALCLQRARRMAKYLRIQAIGGLPVERYVTPNDRAKDRAAGWGWENGRHETRRTA